MVKLYHVVWEIDIYARSPREAAKQAQAIQQDKDAMAMWTREYQKGFEPRV